MNTQEIVLNLVADQEAAQKLNGWIFETIQPYLRGRVLEMNSGHGSISSIFAERNVPIHLSDPDTGNCHNLKNKFKNIQAIRAVHDIDFSHPDFQKAYFKDSNVFGTIIALNITEYGFSEKQAIENAKYLLRSQGRIIIVAPSFTALYDGLVLSLKEWKSYNRKPLKQFLYGFKLIKTINFNLAGNIENSFSEKLGFPSLAIAKKK